MSGEQQSIQQALQQVLAGAEVPADLMQDAIAEMIQEDSPQALIGALLSTLALRGEKPAEIAAAVRALQQRGHAVPVAGTAPLIDLCGTGGTGQKLFNCSTCSALVVAAAGVPVVKHGNRTNTRASGSADLLEAAGVALALTPEQAAHCLREVGMVFLFAPAFHPAMRHVAGIRRELGIRSLFNLVGPLANPGGASHHLLGVHSLAFARPMAQALRELGISRALVVHSDDGLDEISPAAPTTALELTADGDIRELRIDPADFGIATPLRELAAHSPAESLAIVKAVLAGQEHAAAGMVALNAGAALWIADLCPDLKAGVRLARQTLASGAGLQVLERLVATSTSLAAPPHATQQ